MFLRLPVSAKGLSTSTQLLLARLFVLSKYGNHEVIYTDEQALEDGFSRGNVRRALKELQQNFIEVKTSKGQARVINVLVKRNRDDLILNLPHEYLVAKNIALTPKSKILLGRLTTLAIAQGKAFSYSNKVAMSEIVLPPRTLARLFGELASANLISYQLKLIKNQINRKINLSDDVLSFISNKDQNGTSAISDISNENNELNENKDQNGITCQNEKDQNGMSSKNDPFNETNNQVAELKENNDGLITDKDQNGMSEDEIRINLALGDKVNKDQFGTSKRINLALSSSINNDINNEYIYIYKNSYKQKGYKFIPPENYKDLIPFFEKVISEKSKDFPEFLKLDPKRLADSCFRHYNSDEYNWHYKSGKPIKNLFQATENWASKALDFGTDRYIKKEQQEIDSNASLEEILARNPILQPSNDTSNEIEADATVIDDTDYLLGS